MNDWRDTYDDWKLRSPDWDDDPCAEVRAEMGHEIDELGRDIVDLKAERDKLRDLVKMLLDNDPNADAADGVTVLDVWRRSARQLLPPPPEEEIAF